jgi:hypothetical protein
MRLMRLMMTTPRVLLPQTLAGGGCRRTLMRVCPRCVMRKNANRRDGWAAKGAECTALLAWNPPRDFRLLSCRMRLECRAVLAPRAR